MSKPESRVENESFFKSYEVHISSYTDKGFLYVFGMEVTAWIRNFYHLGKTTCTKLLSN